MYKIIENKKTWFTISLSLVVISVLSIAIFGFKLGVDFTGGGLLEVKYLTKRPEFTEIKKELDPLKIEDLTIKAAGESGLILKFKSTDDITRQTIIKTLNGQVNIKEDKNKASDVKPLIEELSYETVGPSVGSELKQKSITALFWVLLVIVLYVTYAFRKVAKPISSWKYGVAALIALFHDVIILCGAFSLLGHFFFFFVDINFIVALLTLLGYSVNDTIVVFDRIRENIPKSNLPYDVVINNSINQTFARSINTSLTVTIALVSIYIWGGESIRNFALALIIGVIVGTYSSIFNASPVLVVWNNHEKRKSK
ncbi:MAG: protein translocase subunit SecF [Candidatus Falkowbacteria bacterium]|nr:protein translocase subunit SecF [Candidatus Falkowbacteria bacterium]